MIYKSRILYSLFAHIKYLILKEKSLNTLFYHILGICLLRHMLCKLVESSTAGLKNYVVLKSFGAPNLTFSLIPEKEYVSLIIIKQLR